MLTYFGREISRDETAVYFSRLTILDTIKMNRRERGYRLIHLFQEGVYLKTSVNTIIILP
jgi:hypothetical protein